MNLLEAVDSIINDMRTYLSVLENDKYAQSLDLLSNSSTGQHTRHVVEFFQCLLAQRETGTINYDKRLRNQLIQEQTEVALNVLDDISDGIKRVELSEKLKLEFNYDCDHEDCTCVDTTFERELVYNVEHAIHHMAMIKIGLRQIAPEIQLPSGFGVAPSTIKHQRESANAR